MNSTCAWIIKNHILKLCYINETSGTVSRLNIYRDYGRSIITADTDIVFHSMIQCRLKIPWNEIKIYDTI